MTEKYFTFERNNIILNNEVWAVAYSEHNADVISTALNNILEEIDDLYQSYSTLKHRHSLLHDEMLDVEVERDGLKKDVESLEKENEQLNAIKKFADYHGINIFRIDDAFYKCWSDNGKLVKENQELKKKLETGICPICRCHVYLCGGLK